MNLFPYILGPVWVLDVTLTPDGHTIAAWRCKMGCEPQQTVYDAAAVDGANGWQVLTRIKLPLISPTIVTCIILCVASAMKTFELPWTMTSGGPAGASTTMVLKIYNTAFNANRTGYATAQSTILFVLIASISFVLNIIMRRREARLQ